MGRAEPPVGLPCPRCGSQLEPIPEANRTTYRLRCRNCGGVYRARRRVETPKGPLDPPVVGGFVLRVRLLLLRTIPPLYRVGVVLGSLIGFFLGGCVPLIRAWLDDRVDGLAGAVGAMGGVWVAAEPGDPDQDFGPILRRVEAPRLFDEIDDVARRLGVRPPEEVRLAFLPCCGVVAWRNSRALLMGMPLLHALTIAELRAILAHEMAHLANGDATWSAQSLRFVEALGRAIDDRSEGVRGPLGAWARLSRWAATGLIGPIARGQEARADRASAGLSGGGVAASALVKVALIQPLFRELLAVHRADLDGGPNLYEQFRRFWERLPGPLLEAMRLSLLASDRGSGDSPHPPLPGRVARIQAYPDLPTDSATEAAARTLIGDPEWLEQVLNDRLFGLSGIEPTTFHRSGS